MGDLRVGEICGQSKFIKYLLLKAHFALLLDKPSFYIYILVD